MKQVRGGLPNQKRDAELLKYLKAHGSDITSSEEDFCYGWIAAWGTRDGEVKQLQKIIFESWRQYRRDKRELRKEIKVLEEEISDLTRGLIINE